MDSKATDSIVTAIGIDIGKNTFHLIGLDECGAIVLRRKLLRGQARIASPTLRRAWSAWRPASAPIM
jgi:hypothetical protein